MVKSKKKATSIGKHNTGNAVKKEPLDQIDLKIEPGLIELPDDAADWVLKFDHIFHLRNCEASLHSLAAAKDRDLPGLYRSTAVDEILRLLKKALGSRISHIEVYSPHTTLLSFGLEFNKYEYKNTVERGPEGNTVEAKDFRDFWGDGVQLRRFPDGGISEAIVFASKTESQKRMICMRIIKLILQRHAAIEPNSVICSGNIWDNTLQYQRIKLPQEWPPYASGEEYQQMLTKNYDTLSRDIRNLKDLPLGINSIRSVSSLARSTQPFPLLPATYPIDDKKEQTRVWKKFMQPLVQTVPVQIVMESSSKWPDTLEAIRRLKTAFMLLIAEALKNLGYTTIVDDVDECQVWKDGFCFKLEIVYLGELGLAKKVVLPDGRVRLEDTPLFEKLRYKYDLLPALTSAISGLTNQEESFALACRLAKRWIGTQLLDGYVSEECVELLMSAVYLQPVNRSVPVAAEAALIRFWKLVSTFDWAKNPLLLNFNRDWKSGDIEDIRRRFVAERSSFPPMCILTPFDIGSTWTKEGLSKLMLKRFVALSKAAVVNVIKDRMSESTVDWKKFFRPPAEEEWDVIIHLTVRNISRRHEMLDLPTNSKLFSFPAVDFKDKWKSVPQHILLDFDTAGIYVESLRKTYGRYAYFLMDPFGGTAVFIKWKSGASEADSFKNGLHGEMLMSENGKIGEKGTKLTANFAAMVEDFSFMGNGIVENVEVRTESWRI